MTGDRGKKSFLVYFVLVSSITGKIHSWECENWRNSQVFGSSECFYETPEDVFQFVNISMDFWRANGFCQHHFSKLLSDEMDSDVEYTSKLLQAAQMKHPIWIMDVYHYNWRFPPFLGKYVSIPALNFKEESHAMYARVDIEFPPLPAVTVCARVQWHSANSQVSTVFSYAALQLTNEFQLRGQQDKDGNIILALIVHGNHKPYKASFRNDGKWHHLCVTWQKYNGNWAIHVDGKRRDSGNGTETSRNIYGSGIFIIGHDQDSFGGNFTEPFVGNITALGIWNKTLDEHQINDLSVCSHISGDLMFMWNLSQMTVKPAPQLSLTKLWCEHPKQIPSEECRTISVDPSQQLSLYKYVPCQRTLPFVCKHNKDSFLKMKEIEEALEGKPSHFMHCLTQLSNDTNIKESIFPSIPKDLSVPEVHDILKFSQQALVDVGTPLEPADMVSLVQFLSQAAAVKIRGNESHDAIRNMSSFFITVADTMFREENINKWMAVKEILNGPMTVVHSIDRMVANLNPLLMAKKSRIVFDSTNIKLEVRQKGLGSGADGSDFHGPTPENETKVDFITVPEDKIQQLYQHGIQNITLINTWYGSLLPLFGIEDNITQFSTVTDGSQKHVGTVLGSSVISATVLGDNRPVNTAVNYELRHRLENLHGAEYEPICAFWDFHLKPEKGGSWSTEGCFITSLGYESTTCFCNHTTNFALLLQIYEVQRTPQDENALRILTFVGCGVSLCGLTMTFILFIAVGVPNSDRTTVHKNLIFALGVAQLLLMFSDLASTNKGLCTAVTALLHLFFLGSFSWMLVEGLLLWSKVVSVNISEDRRMKLYYAIGWGLPVVIVGITLATSFNKYVADNYCWLNAQTDVIWAFVGPVIFVLSVNTVVLFRVVMVTVASARRRSKMLTPSTASQIHALDLTWTATKPVIILLPVLGLTWLCGILVHLSVILAYIFIAMNAFQGLYIFLVYAVYNSEVRNAIRRMKEKKKALSFTNCSQPISFLTSQRATGSWDNSKPHPSASENSESSAGQTGSTKKSLVIQNESFGKDSFVSFSLKPASGNQGVQLTAFKPSGC
ncbi:adhesion G-protein coupled receptor D2 isoform X1 [Lepisosteus oculatus]|uniref:adhesion G-protein coupled receptor D2 isoform X1 n=1 Tax=Lepisosteus oculatus TaxID=7918 RepID=UPI00371BA777